VVCDHDRLGMDLS